MTKGFYLGCHKCAAASVFIIYKKPKKNQEFFSL